jgi:uncharacterized protein GlcG (DUF336 family)
VQRTLAADRHPLNRLVTGSHNIMDAGAVSGKVRSAQQIPNGGLTVEAAGTLLGAVGVSGAPGGDADGPCAKAGIHAVRDKLDF